MIKAFLTTVVLFFITICGYAYHGESLIKIKDNLYIITGLGGNITFLISTDGVLVVDAGTVKQDASKIKKYIQSVTDKPIKYLILTHYHFDHSGGTCGFDKDVKIITHKNDQKNLIVDGQASIDNYTINDIGAQVLFLKGKLDSLKSQKDTIGSDLENRYNNHLQQYNSSKETFVAQPDLIFDGELQIVLGYDTINLVHMGNTHTDGSICVIFKSKNVISTGDFFFNKYIPSIAYGMSDTENWIGQLQRFADYNFDIYIPGHGQIGKSVDLKEQAKYLVDLRSEVEKCIDKGMNCKETIRSVKMIQYSHYEYQFLLECGVQAVYKELKNNVP